MKYMLKQIGTWYFDWGYIIFTVLGFPIGFYSMKKSPTAFSVAMLGAFAFVLAMLYFKYF